MLASNTGGQAIKAKRKEWGGSVLPKVQNLSRSSYVKVTSVEVLLVS